MEDTESYQLCMADCMNRQVANSCGCRDFYMSHLTGGLYTPTRHFLQALPDLELVFFCIVKNPFFRVDLDMYRVSKKANKHTTFFQYAGI